jgi:endonuclease/exonuclease/phosphatase family metal-dependent hydrolase
MFRRGINARASVLLLTAAATAASTAADRPATMPAGPAEPKPHHIVLDGSFDDWDSIPVLLDDSGDAPGAFVDFGEIKVTHDANFVHLLIDFGNLLNLQGLDGTATLHLNVDGRDITGQVVYGVKGIDLMVDLTPPATGDRRGGMGVGLRSTVYQPDLHDPMKPPLSPYQIGFTFAPTHASEVFELRFARGTHAGSDLHIFTGESFSAFLTFTVNGKVLDRTEVVTHTFDTVPSSPLVYAGDADPLARADDGLRVVSWNGQYGALVSNPEPFLRCFSALRPDVILMQEMSNNTRPNVLARLMNTHLPLEDGREWTALMGQGGGDLHCAVLTHLPTDAVKELRIVPYPDRPEQSLRVAGVNVTWQNKRVLVCSVHLKCCGRLGGREDAKRELEAATIHDLLKAVTKEYDVDGIVVAGDLNLVGGRHPLDRLAGKADVDGSPLAIAQPLQLDGTTNATWEDPSQPFVPGRLDYLLYSDASMSVMRQFVLDSRDLAPGWLQTLGIERTDTQDASDHLPLVVDLAWNEAKTSTDSQEQ